MIVFWRTAWNHWLLHETPKETRRKGGSNSITGATFRTSAREYKNYDAFSLLTWGPWAGLWWLKGLAQPGSSSSENGPTLGAVSAQWLQQEQKQWRFVGHIEGKLKRDLHACFFSMNFPLFWLTRRCSENRDCHPSPFYSFQPFWFFLLHVRRLILDWLLLCSYYPWRLCSSTASYGVTSAQDGVICIICNCLFQKKSLKTGSAETSVFKW